MIQNREEQLVAELEKLKINFRFYTDLESGKRRWTSLNIYELDIVLECLQIENILFERYDRRLSPIDKLSMVQLKDVCNSHGLSTEGKKVRFHFYDL